ncbi:hypothetical protein D1872_246980 [compost metagenome]
MEQSHEFDDPFAQVQVHIRGHLVVTASAGMQLASDRADLVDQLLLDVHMNVFVRNGILQLASTDFVQDGMEAVLDFVHIVRRKDAAFSQHRHVRETSLHVLLRQRLVKSDRSGIFLHQTVRLLRKTSTPQLAHLIHSLVLNALKNVPMKKLGLSHC